ncbi:MAG: hypothetical protein QME60_06505 [Verrucomicrobiota bacterium]|nr:hypothetical protein [Verrucomicrobiota bacterium]
MLQLSATGMILGGAVAALFAPLLLAPGQALGWMRKFPRNRRLAWILTAVDLVWAGWLMYVTPFPWIDPYKQWVALAAPVVFFLIVIFMDELLAARAFGGLLLLAPAPILDAAFLHPSPLRLVVVVVAYALAAAGIALVLNPYLFRTTVARLLKTESLCRVWGGAGLFLGAFIIGLAFWTY